MTCTVGGRWLVGAAALLFGQEPLFVWCYLRELSAPAAVFLLAMPLAGVVLLALTVAVCAIGLERAAWDPLARPCARARTWLNRRLAGTGTLTPGALAPVRPL